MAPAIERVNFYNPQAGKPANLQNSAVLRMLEEEETRRSGYVGVKRVAWPPPQEGVLDPADVAQPAQQSPAHIQVAASRPQGKPVEPPPSTITLRPSAPVSQKPAPVYSAQPATASLRVVVGGKHLRGDLKWPPEDVRHRMAEEDRLRIELAQGPACRPTRKDKNYEPFFAQHALNSTYPGYKIPPGTQFYRPE